MKKNIEKIITTPSFYGSVFGAITGGFTGMIIAAETGKSVERSMLNGMYIGILIGSSYASISSLNNKKQVIDFLKLYRQNELIDNLFA